MLDLIASWLLRGLNLFLHLMPMRFNLWLGRRVGWIIYILSGKRKYVTYANLKAAFCKEKTPRELRKLTKKVYRHLGQTFVELASLTKVDEKYAKKYIKITNSERLEEATKNPNGMIFLTAHLGNWELEAAKSVHIGFPLYILARDQKMKKLNEILHKLRESKGNFVIRKGMDVKNIFRVLRDGHSVGIVADQNAGVNGELLDFFGRPASTPIGPFRIAQKVGAWVLPSLIHREEGPYHEVVVEEIMKIGKDEDLVPYMKEYNRLLEKHIRNYPDQWFWMHKRWKATTLKKVLILDDGKKGHLNQSLAVAKQLQKKRAEEGRLIEDTPIKTIRVKFKSKTKKALFNAASVFFRAGCQGYLGFLKWALEKESYEKLSREYTDIVISCGSTLFGVNKLLKIENSARNVTIFDPGKFNRKGFDLIIVPRHDLEKKKITETGRILAVDLAPNLIDPEELKVYGREKEKCIGVLVGGENSQFTFDKPQAEELSRSIKSASKKEGAKFYITTSRRTLEEADSSLENSLSSDPSCIGFILGKEDKDPHTVEKILAVSSVVIVSGESISMVSEAVSSGKPTLVFMPRKKREGETKYERFIKDLENSKYLKIVSIDNIPEAAGEALSGRSGLTLPDDDKRIYERMYKLY